MITMSDGNEVLIVGGYSKYVYVYMNQGDKFVTHNYLSEESSSINTAEITGDGKWILSIHDNGKIVIYKFNHETHKYEKHQLISSTYSVYEGAITDDHMWMAYVNHYGVKVYKFDGNKFIINQNI